LSESIRFLNTPINLKFHYDFSPVAEMWCVELMLSNEDDEQSKALAEYLRKEIGETTTIWTLGDFLIKVGQYKQAEDYYRLLEHILPESDINQATIYNRIAYARYEREDYNAALDCIKIAMQYAPKNSEVAIVTEYNQQMIVAEASLAILCAPALRRQFEDYNINGKYLVSNSASISIISNNLGRIYHKLGHFHHALRYYDDALKILLKSELSFLPEISAIYNNIGGVQYSKGNYNDAAENFLLAMTTLSKLDSNHPWIREYTDNYQAAHCRMDSNKPKRLKAE
jgi:tetratricopeptide (TPR) repeat protein